MGGSVNKLVEHAHFCNSDTALLYRCVTVTEACGMTSPSFSTGSYSGVNRTS